MQFRSASVLRPSRMAPGLGASVPSSLQALRRARVMAVSTALLFGGGALVAAVSGVQQAQPPVYRGGVELVAVDVQIIDKDGKPIPSLGPADFEVSINGGTRRVVSAEFVRYSTSAASGDPAPPKPAPAADGTSPPRAATGRMIVLAVDEHSFRFAAARAAMQAAARFIDHLEASDIVGLYAYPTGAANLNLTRDHASVRKSLDTIVGLLDVPTSRYNLSLTEVVDITAGDPDVVNAVVARECPRDARNCAREVRAEAISLGAQFEMQVSQSLNGLHALLQSLSRVPNRKTLVLVSGGLLAADRTGGRPDLKAETLALGHEAAAANTSLYVLHMDSSFLDAFSAANKRGATPSLLRDSAVLGSGLDLFSGAAGGTLVRIEAGTGDRAFEQVLRETSAYYLLGVEPAANDRDGKVHNIRVKVRQRGATVRSRTSVVIPKPGPSVP
jgi:VWFA-related protein